MICVLDCYGFMSPVTAADVRGLLAVPRCCHDILTDWSRTVLDLVLAGV